MIEIYLREQRNNLSLYSIIFVSVCKEQEEPQNEEKSYLGSYQKASYVKVKIMITVIAKMV